MTYGQLIKYNLRNILLQKSYRKWDHFQTSFLFFLKKLYTTLKQVSDTFSIGIFCKTSTWTYNKNNVYHISDISWGMLNFCFFTKGSGTSFSTTFSVWSFKKKKYFSSYILLTDQISLSGCLYFLRYWAIYVLRLSANHVVTS